MHTDKRLTPESVKCDGHSAGLAVENLARQLLDQCREIAAGLTHGEAGLVGRRLGLVSCDARDFLLGRLLACFGARVVFLTPSPVQWVPALHEPLVQALRRQLADLGPHLDLGPLESCKADTFRSSEGFVIRVTAGDRPEFLGLQALETVIALGVLPPAPVAALEESERLATLLQVGGELELLATAAAPLPAATLRYLEAQAGTVGLGVRVPAKRADAGQARLSLIRLSGPLHEFPIEGDEAAVVLAHCRARLDFAANYVPGCDVLEAGAGTGIGGRLFLDRGARHVVCLDRSEEALAKAALHSGGPRLQLRQWDLNQAPLPFPDASFDVVVCLEVLEHITAHEAAVAEFLRVLRPGGRLIISVPDHTHETEWAALNRHGNPYHLRVPSRAEFLALLQRFDDVTLAEQRDYVGSAVVPCGDRLPTGTFLADAAEVSQGMASVQLAVCTKAPVTSARPVATQLTLRLYDNFSERQLAQARHTARLEEQVVNARHAWWAACNRARNGLERCALEGQQAARIFARVGGAAVSSHALEPGPWMDTLARELRAVGTVNRPSFQPGVPCWSVEAGQVLVLAPRSELPRQVHSVIFPVGQVQVGAWVLWSWVRRGTVAFWFYEEDYWRQLDAAAALARAVYQRTARRLIPAAWMNHRAVERAFLLQTMARAGRCGLPETLYPLDSHDDVVRWQHWIEDDNTVVAGETLPCAGQPLRVTHYTGALYAGGAERQLCNLALGQTRRGYRVEVLTTAAPVGTQGHYADLLIDGGIPLRQARGPQTPTAVARPLPAALLRGVPAEVREHVRCLVEELRHDPPDILHCWLDQPNLIGAMAGLLAGVPRILLSTRNSNPTHFPRLHSAWMQSWYRRLAASRRVHFLANSHSGAASYASWIGIDVERFHVVLNGICLDHFARPTPVNRQAARRAFGLDDHHRVVCGLFRLDPEKQPALFLEVVRRAAASVPDLRVLLAGTGSQAEWVRSEIERTSMGKYVQLLGRRRDVDRVLLAGDVLLLTSTLEGCPNVVLEAQYLGLPVVATDGGGTHDALLPGRTGFLTAVDDAPALTAHLVRILTDHHLRRQLGAAGEQFVRTTFDLDQMVELTNRVYEQMFLPPDAAERVVTPHPGSDWGADELATACQPSEG